MLDGEKKNDAMKLLAMRGTIKMKEDWVETIDSDGDIHWKKDKQDVYISLADDGYWVLYGPDMGALGQGFKKKDDAIKFAKHRYDIKEEN